MLVEFTVQNFTSFNTPQTFSMLASSTTKENFKEENTFNVNKFGISNLLKSSALFGANASGKSNFVSGIQMLKGIILESLTTAESNKLSEATPFLIKPDTFDHPTEFEIVFLSKGNLYRYGISIVDNIIVEEWLYWTKTKRETKLFHRKKQTIEINKRSFSESIDFVQEKKGALYLEKTRENVPFISVLSQFNGKKSRTITEWFRKLHIISGTNELGFKMFTTELFEKNSKFKSWALDILSSLQIQDINVVEVELNFPPKRDTNDDDLNDVMQKVEKYIVKNKIKDKKIEIIKSNSTDDNSYTLPLSLESKGTIKLIYLLGPLFDCLVNGEILIIDEFDSKFHSLLSKFILDLYHIKNCSQSQLIITCHDTNLLTKESMRRDQIWFIEKNKNHESELYSLLEYKEHYTRRGNSYSKDYLNGKYGAIPLLKSIDNLMA